MLSTSNSSESDSSNIGFSSRVEEAAGRASAQGVRRSELSDEDWECAAAVLSPPNRYICEPHDLSRLGGCGSRTAGRASLAASNTARRERSTLIGSASQSTQAAPSRAARACCAPKQWTHSWCVSTRQDNIYIACDKQHQIRHTMTQSASWRAKSWLCYVPASITCYVMPSHVTSWRNTNQDWNSFIHASDALRWGGSPKVSLPTQCEFPRGGTNSL